MKQWTREILDKTDLTEDEVKEYTGEIEGDRPGHRRDLPDPHLPPRQDRGLPALRLFEQRDWGLIIYDEVHLLPAPVFRVTATDPGPPPARPDRHAGPRGRPRGRRLQPDRPEEVRRAVAGLETKGWIADGELHRDPRRPAGRPMPHGVRRRRLPATSTASPARTRPRTTSWPSCWSSTTTSGCSSSASTSTQLQQLGERFELPLITGATPNAEREDLYGKFRRGEVRHLVLSQGRQLRHRPAGRERADPGVAAPSAAGRKRPSGSAASCGPSERRGDAHFYTLVTRDTRELDFAHHRQLFLTEQGYSYEILDEREVRARPRPASPGPEVAPMTPTRRPPVREAAPPGLPRPHRGRRPRRGTAGPQEARRRGRRAAVRHGALSAPAASRRSSTS